MRVVSLLYHDVVPAVTEDTSGFPGRAAGRYKLEPSEFRAHLRAIARAASGPAGSVLDLDHPGATHPAFLITFDDGGITAYHPVADLLDELGWRGHFFITTDYIDTPAFLTRDHIRELRRRGHVIGSHSASHPTRMAHLTRSELVEEWSKSTDILSNILGESVTVASVPGGYYAPKVAEAAVTVGIRILFNSEPATRSAMVDGCHVLGRYTLWKGMSAGMAAGFVSGRFWPRARQWCLWNAKKLAKSAGGRVYLKVRDLLYN